MKRFLSFALVALLSLSVMSSTVFAATPQITAKNLDIHKSEEITLSFNITPKSGIAAAGFELTYDHKKFTFVEYGYGEAFEGGMTAAHDNGDVKENGVGLFKYGYVNIKGTDNGGEMFFVTFKTADTVKAGEKYEFKLTCTESTDKNATPIKLNNVTVVATVKDGAPQSKIETSRVIGDTSATIEAESVLSSEKSTVQNNQTKTDTDGTKNNTALLIIIAVLAVIIIASIVVIILVLIKKKQTTPEEEVMTNILADDAETDFLNEDALANENASEIDEFDEFDEFDE